MKQMLRFFPALLAVLAMPTLGAHAQSNNYWQSHGFSLSVGGDGQFTRTLTTNPNSGGIFQTEQSDGIFIPVAVQNQRQYTTDSAGFLTSVQFHPVAWAGVEVNYGFTHYQERFSYNLASTGMTTVTNTSTMQTHISTDSHEATAAYQFHLRRLRYQPFVNVGGGAIDFNPRGNRYDNQWRGAGLVETGMDMPVRGTHFGFRIEGRSLIYRAPNYYQAALSTRSWRATVEPSASVYYHF